MLLDDEGSESFVVELVHRTRGAYVPSKEPDVLPFLLPFLKTRWRSTMPIVKAALLLLSVLDFEAELLMDLSDGGNEVVGGRDVAGGGGGSQEGGMKAIG
ncbi:unnamed protein product, partial [Tilletia laevis]